MPLGKGAAVVARVRWSERWERPGWRTAYTPLGGRPPAGPASVAMSGLTEARQAQVSRLTSDAFIAISGPEDEVSEDVRFFVAVARKIIQRGANPVVWTHEPPSSEMDSNDLYSAALGPELKAGRELDQSIRLDTTFERPLWLAIEQQYPGLDRFVIPQPSLEGMAGVAGGSRWADFVVHAPWAGASVVIELDGSQHQRAADVDSQRDRALGAAGFRVVRIEGRAALNEDSLVHAGLRWTAAERPLAAGDDSVAAVHAPAAFTRLAIALLELLEAGHLEPGGVWTVDLTDDLGWGVTALPAVLDLLNGIGLVWGLNVAPTELHTCDSQWVRHESGYENGAANGVTVPATRIVLEPFVPPSTALPPATVPTVVVRGAYIPGELAWLPRPVVQRRDLADGPDVERGLGIVLRHLFGFGSFREGQRESILAALEGQDACVLLPTGAGKSLIYQVAGLLQPGVTLVIDPLVSLVDDQERRLLAVGVDRVVGIHARKTSKAADRDAVYASVASGDALIVFHTPERLQSQAFRDALAEAVRATTVNLVVVDEAHCVSEWGHDFRTAYLRLGRNVRLLTRRETDDRPPPMLALTGTASPAVLRDVLLELEADSPTGMEILKPATFDRPNLTYEVSLGSPESWTRRLATALTETIPTGLECEAADLAESVDVDTRSGIVFVPHTNGTFGVQAIRSEVLAALRPHKRADADFRVGIYSGSRPKSFSGDWDSEKVREAALFTSNDSTILVSTKAFGMGIDKPNIRWTIHVGHPGSLEGFVQEAGRAGRDRRASHCVLVATPPPPELSEVLLDVSSSRVARTAAYEAASKGRQSDDVTRQYFFLTTNYEGIEAELVPLRKMLTALLRHRPGDRVIIAREGRFDSEEAAAQEKALYRLALVGVVDDYTIDYGAGAFHVDLDYFDNASLDDALLTYVSRIQPAAGAARRAELADAPNDLGARVEHHLEILLSTLYDVIEPARVRALAEMHLFATSGDDDEGLRRRILAYLSDGPLAGIFSELGSARQIDVAYATAQLDAAASDDPLEWVGAAARQLEVFPDHPLLLAARGLGEAMRSSPDVGLVEASFTGVWSSMVKYGTSEEDCVALFDWITGRLRTAPSERAGSYIPALWTAWEKADLSPEHLVHIEDRALDRVAFGEYHPAELAWILTRRLDRFARAADRDLLKTARSE